MSTVLYLDIEATLDSKIQEYGLLCDSLTLKTSSIEAVKKFLSDTHPNYIVGHNFVEFDQVLLEQTSMKSELHKTVKSVTKERISCKIGCF